MSADGSYPRKSAFIRGLIGTPMILEAIIRARRRLLWNALAVRCAHALSAGLSVLLLLLLLGTGIVHVRWLVILPAAALVIGVAIAWRQLPDTYRTSQLLDHRLRLADALSTALFFRSRERRQPDEDMRRAQWDAALRVAAGVQIREAFPLKMPKAIYVSVLLAVIAAGLFALRYGSEARLDLRQPMAALQQILLKEKEEIAKLDQPRQQDPADPQQRQGDSQRGDSRDATPPGKDAGQSDATDANSPSSSPQAADHDDAAEKAETAGDAQDVAEAESQPDESDRDGNEQSESSNRKTGTSSRQKQQASGNRDAESSNSSSSVFSKIGNTVANLLSVLKPQAGGKGQRNETGRGAKPRDTRQDSQSGASGRPQDTQGLASRSKEADGGQPGTAPVTGAGSDPQAAQPGSSAGLQDGKKESTLADQIAAMGKISVILGKRAQDLSGNASIYVQPGDNRLKTLYEQRNVEHTLAQPTVERDEVPLALQDYVQEYFKQVNEGRARSRVARQAK